MPPAAQSSSYSASARSTMVRIGADDRRARPRRSAGRCGSRTNSADARRSVDPELVADLEHIDPMRTTGHDQQRLPRHRWRRSASWRWRRPGSRDMRPRRARCGRLVEDPDATRQPGGLPDGVDGLDSSGAWSDRSPSATVSWSPRDKQKDLVIATRSLCAISCCSIQRLPSVRPQARPPRRR